MGRGPSASYPVSAGLRIVERLEDRTLLAGATDANADLDGDGQFHALGDGVLAIRYFDGLRGDALVNHVANPAGRRSDPASLAAYLDTPDLVQLLDIDIDGARQAVSDGRLFLRALAGFTDEALVGGAVNPEGGRTDPEVISEFVKLVTNIEDFATTDEDTVLTVPAMTGLLANDPVGTSITPFATTSELGATVSVAADGSYTYDPTAAPLLQEIHAFDSVTDTFTYTAEHDNGSQVVTVSIQVDGKADGAEDHYETNENTIIDGFVNGAIGKVLANDPSGATIVSYDEYSSFGAFVIIDTDGTFYYDPNQSSLGGSGSDEVSYDRLTYTALAGGQEFEVTVTVAVAGVDDPPVADAVEAFTSSDEPININVLESASVEDAANMLSLMGIDTSGTLGTVTIDPAGFVRYDPSTSQILMDLSADEQQEDSFKYTVTDLAGMTATGTVTINVFGIPHAPVAVNDNYTGAKGVNSYEVSFFDAENGLLANDSDLDGDALFVVSATTLTSTMGAKVTVFEDGAFDYDPTGSEQFAQLDPNTIVQDTFSYTINDEYMDGESQAQVTLDVTIDFPVFTRSTIQLPEGGVLVDVFLFDNGATTEVIVQNKEATVLYFRENLSAVSFPIVINGGSGDDIIDAHWLTDPAYPVILNGGPGDDYLVGGAGADVLNGGPGIDTLNGGPGSDRLNGEAGDDIFEDRETHDVTDADPAVEFAPLPLNLNPTRQDLEAQGPLNAFVRSTGNVVSLGLYGQSLYGFEIVGPWQQTIRQDGGETFTAVGTVGAPLLLKSEIGDIPIPVTLTIQTAPDQTPFYGVVEGDGAIFTLSTNNPIFNTFSQFTGIQFGLQELQLGIALGSVLKELIPAAPLNDAIPYLFTNLTAGGDIATVGNRKITAGPAFTVGFVFDPADPFFWIGGSAAGAKVSGALSVGYSKKGLIPFTPNPETTPQNVMQSDYKIFGNLWGAAAFDFRKFSFRGDFVLDLNRQNGPTSEDITGAEFSGLLNGTSAIDTIVSALANIELGINGSVTFRPGLQNDKLGVEVNVAGTAMYYGGNTIALKGVATNPFGFMSRVGFSPDRISADGFVNINTNEFRITVAVEGGKISGFQLQQASMTLSNTGMSGFVVVNAPLGLGQTRFFGSLSFVNGAFEFGLARTSSFSLGFLGDVSISNTLKVFGGPQGLGIDVSGSIRYRSYLLDVDGYLRFVAFVTSTGQVRFEGSGYLKADPLGGGRSNVVTISFRISNDSFSLNLPIVGTITVPLPRFLHADGELPPAGSPDNTPTLTSADLPAIIDEAIRRLQGSGLSDEQTLQLQSVEFRIEKLDDKRRQLGYATQRMVVLDDNAAGYGWFIDPTPADDDEFDQATGRAVKDGPAADRIDLVSTVMHEFTHVLDSAFADESFDFGESVTSETLSTGQRFEAHAHSS